MLLLFSLLTCLFLVLTLVYSRHGPITAKGAICFLLMIVCCTALFISLQEELLSDRIEKIWVDDDEKDD